MRARGAGRRAGLLGLCRGGPRAREILWRPIALFGLRGSPQRDPPSLPSNPLARAHAKKPSGPPAGLERPPVRTEAHRKRDLRLHLGVVLGAHADGGAGGLHRAGALRGRGGLGCCACLFEGRRGCAPAYAHTHTHAHTPPPHTHAHAHTRTHAHTHADRPPDAPERDPAGRVPPGLAGARGVRRHGCAQGMRCVLS